MSDLFGSIAELERIAAADRGIDLERERREDREAMALCDELEDEDGERADDQVEEVLSGWKGGDGFPIDGFESPRFDRSERRSAYYRWLMSEEGRRTREIVHPKLEDRIRRRNWQNETDSLRSYDEER